MLVETTLQIRSIESLANVVGPTNFLIIIGLYILYQIYSPEYFPDTKFQKIVGEFEDQISDIENNVGEKLDDFGNKQLAHIQITRAIASVKNPAEEIDAEVVDRYLIRNGVDKDDFLKPKEGGSQQSRIFDDDRSKNDNDSK